MRKRSAWLVVTVIVVLAAALALAACGSNSTATTAAPAGSATTAGGATTTVGAATVDAAAIYAQYCAGCHKNIPGGSADSIRSAAENGWGGEMPGFKDKLTAEEIAALATWVANGGK